MYACLELSRLPKSHLGPKSVTFKRTTPGSIGFLVFSKKPPPTHRVVDPSHPALRLDSSQFVKTFPWRRYPGFALRAVPKSILDKPAIEYSNPPFALAPVRSAGKDREDGRVSMSLLNVAVSKQAGGRVLRVNVLNKLKTAISLIVTRGADVEEGPDGQRIVFRDKDAGGAGWVLADWTYMCRLEPHVNLMPYHTLIPSLRVALHEIVVSGRQLEEQWTTKTQLRESVSTAELATSLIRSINLGAAAARRASLSHSPTPARVTNSSEARQKHVERPRPASPASSAPVLEESVDDSLLQSMLQRIKNHLPTKTERRTKQSHNLSTDRSPAVARHKEPSKLKITTAARPHLVAQSRRKPHIPTTKLPNLRTAR